MKSLIWMKGFIALFVCNALLAVCQPSGVVCVNPYDNVIQTHNTDPSSGKDVKFTCGAQIFNSPTGVLTTREIDLRQSCKTNSCVTTNCRASGTSVNELNVGIFQTSSSNVDVTVSAGNSSSIGGSESDFRTVQVNSGSTLDFTSTTNAPIFKIQELILVGGTVNLISGDYWVETLTVNADDSKIQVIGSGTARLFVKNIIEINKDIEINSNNTNLNAAGQFWLYGFEDMMFDKRSDIVGFLYSQKKITFKKNQTLTGAIAAQEVSLQRDSVVIYDENAVSHPTLQICSSGTTYYQIAHDGTGFYCLGENITISAMNDNNSQVCSEDTIVINTNSNTGTWSLAGGNGTFTDLGNGMAQYQFSTLDSGQVNLSLYYTDEGVNPINISAYNMMDSSITDNQTHGLLTFSPSGFLLTNTLGSTIPYSGPIVAGEVDTVYITVFGQDETHPVCGVIEEYRGTKNLQFWFDYTNPTSGTKSVKVNGVAIGSSEGQAKTIPVNFTDGTASVNIEYSDVGKVKLHVKEGLLIGATTPFVSIPHKMIATVSGNPAATSASGNVFKKAGEAFTVTVEVQDINGNITPNYGNETIPQGVVLKADLILPAGGRNGSDGNGTIINGNQFSKIANGVFQCTTCAFDEVGIIQLYAAVNGADYLGSGDVATKPNSANVGRFIPHHFDTNVDNVDTIEFNAGCLSCGFTYLDQPFTYNVEPQVTVTAKSSSGTITENYQGDFWKFTDLTLLNTVYNAGSPSTPLESSAAENAVNAIDNNDGTTSFVFNDGGGLKFQRPNRSAGDPPCPAGDQLPFSAEIELSFNIQDTDNVLDTNNPQTIGGTSTGSGLAFNPSNNMRHGRMRLYNSIGSELADLPVPIETEYCSSTGFIRNTEDTDVGDGGSIFNNENFVLLAPELNNSNLPVLNTTAIVTSFISGEAGLILTSPTPSGQSGYVDLEVDLSATGTNQPWLQYDWSNTGTYNENPRAKASFGIRSGNDGVIYKKEIY